MSSFGNLRSDRFGAAAATSLLLALLLLGTSQARVSDTPQPQIRLLPNPDHPGFCLLELPTVANRTYFLKYSFDLELWSYFTFVERGDGTTTSYDFSCNVPTTYLSAQYTDAQYFGDPGDADFDNDGWTNAQEIALGIDPFTANQSFPGFNGPIPIEPPGSGIVRPSQVFDPHTDLIVHWRSKHHQRTAHGFVDFDSNLGVSRLYEIKTEKHQITAEFDQKCLEDNNQLHRLEDYPYKKKIVRRRGNADLPPQYIHNSVTVNTSPHEDEQPWLHMSGFKKRSATRKSVREEVIEVCARDEDDQITAQHVFTHVASQVLSNRITSADLVGQAENFFDRLPFGWRTAPGATNNRLRAGSGHSRAGFVGAVPSLLQKWPARVVYGEDTAEFSAFELRLAFAENAPLIARGQPVSYTYFPVIHQQSAFGARSTRLGQPITLEWDGKGHTSDPITIDSRDYLGREQSGSVSFLLVEVAPEVLAVNSDFDEGRIKPDTGFAIPDCDDVKDVDVKTGAGNTLIGLNAVRDHLENGAIKAHKLTTEDLHQGWFGVNPQQLGDDFWDGATVTIRKLDKIDPDTGRKESGQIRFYAKWGDSNGDYYGIVPYDLETLTPNNLVTSGVNGKPGEGVYGSTSTIPDDAEFWMEGVRPGKITLEWRLQKGDIDIKYEQSFLVETRKSPREWKEDLAYKIRLDTDNDPSGEIDILVNPRRAPREYWVRIERMSEYYDYYQENYLIDDSFQWAGLARLAGSQVIGGVSDARFGTLTPSGIVDRIVGEIIDAMSEGGFDIFDSLAWQHHAYRSSGIGGMEWTDENSAGRDLNELIDSWREFDDGFNTGDVRALASAALEMTRHEQQEIIVPTWNNLRRITLENGDVTDIYTILAENVMKPNGDRFTVAVPTGNLANTSDRWKWIEDTASGSPNGIVGAWKAAGKAGQKAFVQRTLKIDSQRFTLVPNAVRARFGGIQVNDDLDRP